MDALTVLKRHHQVIALSWPLITPATQPPPRLPDEVIEAAEAKLFAHSSKELRRLLNRWVDRRSEFYAAGASIDYARAHPGQGSSKGWQELGAARVELIGDRQPEGGVLGEIAAQMRKELGYKD